MEDEDFYETGYPSFDDYEDSFSWLYQDQDEQVFLDEIGLPHYCLSFDWEKELEESGYFNVETEENFKNNIVISIDS